MLRNNFFISLALLGFLLTPIWTSASPVSPNWVLVDDYEGTSVPGRVWYYSRIGTDKGKMGSGSYTAKLGNGTASIHVNSGWSGVWTSLLHLGKTQDSLNPERLLGPWIKSQYQAELEGIRINLIDGSGWLKVELKDNNNQSVFVQTRKMNGGAQSIYMPVSISSPLKLLNWIVDSPGFAIVDKIWFKIQAPTYDSLEEMVFLFSYSALSQCYDHNTGLVRDRARWPVEDFATTPTMGTFALISAIANQLGYIDKSEAAKIISKIRDKLLELPTYHNLFPHFIKKGDICPGTEWSTIDTTIALISSILASQAMDLDTKNLEKRLKDIDWADLTDNHTRSISWGYKKSGEKIAERIDVFGSEALLASLVYAATIGKICPLEKHDTPPTWDGSGFNDKMADLFFPTNFNDAWGNNWVSYKQNAYEKQKSYLNGKSDYLGLSACEVPHPWEVAEDEVYQAFGVGGHNQTPNDGQELLGYVPIAPHYSAMISLEHRTDFEKVFGFLVQQRVFSPLNNVESFGISNQEGLRFNALKGAWNLSLQALGTAAALSERGNYLPYMVLDKNKLLKSGFDKIIPVKSVTAPIISIILD